MKQKQIPLLQLQGMTKAYASVIANEDISLSIHQGQIHSLLGENGAGKSTLVNMIYGLVKPDAGIMLLDGKPYKPKKPNESRQAGVGIVFQHFSLFQAMTVAENIALGMENPPKMKELEQRISKISKDYKLPLSPTHIIADLSAGEQQRVEIIRCLLQNPRLLIMDEPTSVLTPQEVDVLIATLRALAAEGTAILYISHKLNEIRSLCESATILRGGKVVGNCDPRKETSRSMAEMMVGNTLNVPTERDMNLGSVVFSVENLSVPSSNPFGTSLQGIEFQLHKGEIMGIGGVAGNGQDELLATLSGEKTSKPASLVFKGNDISLLNINKRRSLGILSAPEERLGHAAVPSMSLTENVMLTARLRKKLSSLGFLHWKKADKYTKHIIEDFDVRTSTIHAEAKSLSGGNLQKFVIAREVHQQPELLILNQPTWGVDAAAAADIRESLKQLTMQGTAVIIISQDIDELIEISDQFAVIAGGRLSSKRNMDEFSIDQIGLMMSGQLDALNASKTTRGGTDVSS